MTLDALHKCVGQQPSEDEAIALARFIGEVPPRQIETKADGLRSVVLILTECYALHGAEYSADTRWRLAEELAALRRRSESGDAEWGELKLGALVDQVIRGLLRDCKELAAPLAHLILSRYWLPAPTLEVLREIQHWDQAAWGWPILTALQQSLPANRHLTVDPIPMAPPPSDQEGDVHRRMTRYAAVRERWQQQIKAKEERTQDSLAVRTEELEIVWQAAQVDGGFLRVVVALWGMAENIEAARWLKEYQDLASFLQKPDTIRETIIDAEPALFLWRFGNDDVVYSAAVYLDTNPGQRHKRFNTAPQFGPAFAVRNVDPDLFLLVKQAARSSYPVQHLRRLVEGNLANTSPDFRIAAELLGIEAPDQQGEHVAAMDGAAYLISDAAFRALNVHLADWFSEQRGLTEAETAALYAYLRALQSRAGRGLSQDAKIEPGSSAFHVNQWSRKWRHVFEGTSDDAVYSFAVCLDTAGPAKDGGSDRPGSAALVSHILAAEGLDPLLGPAQQLPLWGISSSERVLPWEYWHRLFDLCLLACEVREPFGEALLQLFSRPEEMSPAVRDELEPTRELLAYLAAEDEDEFIPLTPVTPQVLKPFQDWIRTAITTFTEVEKIIQEAEYRIEREGVNLDESLRPDIEELAARLGEVSELDRCLFLLRLARHAEPSIASRWTELAFVELENVPDLYAQAEASRRFRINAAGELPSAFHRHLNALRNKSAVLAAFAEGRLGSHLCHDSFAWNRDPVLRCEAAWSSVSAYAALQEWRKARTIPIDLNSMWRSLRQKPQLGLVRELLVQGIESGLECTLEAFECLHDLCSRKGTVGLHVERLIPLLRRPSNAALARIRGLLNGSNAAAEETLTLGRQASILLAEAYHEFPGPLVDSLLACLENEDDLMAFKAELLLAGPRRDAERKTRRNSLKHTPWQQVADWGGMAANGESAFVRRMAGLAINSWQFDDSKQLAQWCAAAAPDSDEEQALEQAMRWVDVWDEESLAVLSKWALAHPAGGRDTALVHLAGRLSRLHRSEPGIDLAIKEISKLSRVRQTSCPKWIGEKSEDLDAAVLDASLKAAACSPDSLPVMPHDPLYPSDSDVPDPEALRRFGSLRYFSIGSFPEQALPIIYPYADQPNLARTLVYWLEESIQTWSSLDRATKSDAEGICLAAIIASLLSLSTSLSAVRPSLFAQVADPDRFAPLLGSVCLSSFDIRSMMGAITLLFRLRKIDLTHRFMVEGNEHTLLDAVITCLTYNSGTRQRTESVVPQAVGLKGGPILEELGSILIGASRRPGSRRGSVVLACARIIRTLIDTDALTSQERKRAGELLRNAVQDERHRRPLYQMTGLGNQDEPLSYISVGMLDEELARILARRSSRSDDPYS
jgi:hypothetical protein